MLLTVYYGCNHIFLDGKSVEPFLFTVISKVVHNKYPSYPIRNYF